MIHVCFPFQSLFEIEESEDVQKSQSPCNFNKKMHPILTSRPSEKNFQKIEFGKNQSRFPISGLGEYSSF